MKILLLGCTGQVGWELQRSLAPLGELVALSRDSQSNPGKLSGDLSDAQGLVDTVRAVRPDVIVNAAAYTAVDKAESEPDLARSINATAPGVLALEAKRLGAWLLHYSTDYVFDGSGTRAWTETDTVAPLNAYGQTKWEGERAVAVCARHLILRTSWVYGARGGNFAKTMLRLASTRETLQVINDQTGAPTGADLLADCTAHVVRRLTHGDASTDTLAGTYHLAASGHTTWHDYAQFVIDSCRTARPDAALAVRAIEPVTSATFASAAKRPLNSRLDTRKMQATFGLHLPSWETGVARMLTEINYEYAH
ncbi:MAG: dTDP-4-dehydrorhamnose reductase [Rhodoferax sp.]|nr:dTDP-4-dehydrorhamnose reductase [Rhodoferax sp.]